MRAPLWKVMSACLIATAALAVSAQEPAGPPPGRPGPGVPGPMPPGPFPGMVPGGPGRPGHSPRAAPIRVERVDSKYRVATGGTKGWFATGQDADLMLSGIDFNNTGGPLLFSHPTGLASDGKRLLVADRWNNRILVWNELPASNTPPDLVLGQKDFTSNDPGTGKHELNWPGNVAISPDGRHVAVADTYNDRILLWNTFPQKSGAAADVALERAAFGVQGTRPLGWPWGVWTDGKKLAAVVTAWSAVFVWNQLPRRDNEPPDLILRPRNAGTPRNITSDGTCLILSDHNSREYASGPGTYFWKAFPTSATQEPDFSRREWLKGCITADGKLVLAGLQSIYLWDRLPQGGFDQPVLTLRPPSYANGDGPDAVQAGGRLYVCNYNGNNVLVWNALPRTADQPPDFAIGSPDPQTNTLHTQFFITNPVPASNGKSLFISSDFDGKLYVWRHLPDESGAKPDVVYSLPHGLWDNALHGDTLALAGHRSVYLWRKLPLNGELPDAVLADRIGGVPLQEVKGVALDDRYFYLADAQADRVYIWEGIPQADTPPKLFIDVRRPGRLASDGTWLAVIPFEQQTVLLYRVAELAAGGRPGVVGGPGRFNLPGSALVAEGHLFVADTCFSRVHAWARVEDAIAGRPRDVVLGDPDPEDRRPEIGRNRLFWPGALAFDGSYLWVGEFKFSGRVLRFSPREVGTRGF